MEHFKKYWWIYLIIIVFIILGIRYFTCKKKECIQGETAEAQTNCFQKCKFFGSNNWQKP